MRHGDDGPARRAPLPLACVLVLGAAPFAAAEVAVNTYTTYDQAAPAVAAGANGTFVVVWTSDRQTSDGVFCCSGYRHDLVARRLDGSGAPAGPELLVSTHTLLDHGPPSIASNAAGEFVVAWRRGIMEGPQGIFARRFDAAGEPRDFEFQVSASTTTPSYQAPAVAMDGAGRFVVVWTDRPDPRGPVQIRGRRFDAAGAPFGAEFAVVAAAGTRYPGHPAVAMDETGGFLVAWNAQGPADTVVRARHFDAAGGSSPEIDVSTAAAARYDSPAVAALGAGEFVVAWSRAWREGVDARRIGPAGPLADGFEAAAGPAQAPSIAAAPGAGFVVTWTGRDGEPESDGVLGQRFEAGARRQGTPFRVNAYTTLRQGASRAAAQADGSFLVSWTSGGETPGASQDGDGSGVYAQPFQDALFADGFDSGDLNGWSRASTGGGGLRAVARPDGEGQSFALLAAIDGATPLFVEDDTPQDEGRYRAGFAFQARGFDPGEAQGTHRARIFLALEEDPVRRLVALVLRRLDGEYSLRARVRLADQSFADTPFVPISDGEHWIELDWIRALRPESADGSFALWIDGVLAARLTGLDNASPGVGHARLGAIALKPGARGALRWDSFVSRRWSRIGPGAD
jgi:hypothetical protein